MEQLYLHLRYLDPRSTKTSGQDFCPSETCISFVLKRKQAIPNLIKSHAGRALHNTLHTAPLHSGGPFSLNLVRMCESARWPQVGPATLSFCSSFPEICQSALPPRWFPGALKTHQCLEKSLCVCVPFKIVHAAKTLFNKNFLPRDHKHMSPKAQYVIYKNNSKNTAELICTLSLKVHQSKL